MKQIRKQNAISNAYLVAKFRKSVKGMFSRNQYPGEKDLNLLTKLAELKQNGILTKKRIQFKKEENSCKNAFSI